MSLLAQVKTSRQHFIEQAQASSIPDIKAIGEEVKQGRRGLGDFVAYAIVDGSGKTIVEFLQTQDKEEIGVKNIASAKLEKGEVFLPDTISVLAGTSAATTYDDAAIAAIAFASVGAIPAIANGEFELQVNNKIIIPRSSMRMFVTDGQNVPIGHYGIVNPKIIENEVLIYPVVRTKLAIPAKTALMLILRGTVTTPA